MDDFISTILEDPVTCTFTVVTETKQAQNFSLILSEEQEKPEVEHEALFEGLEVCGVGLFVFLIRARFSYLSETAHCNYVVCRLCAHCFIS
jgi:hypothetical protein